MELKFVTQPNLNSGTSTAQNSDILVVPKIQLNYQGEMFYWNSEMF